MTESEIHKLIKEKIAEALRELGYETRTEYVVTEGRLDVFAYKKDCEPIRVEVQHTNIPDWILAKVKGDLPKNKLSEAPIESPIEGSPIPGYWKEESPYHERKRKEDEERYTREIREDMARNLEFKIMHGKTELEKSDASQALEYLKQHPEEFGWWATEAIKAGKSD